MGRNQLPALLVIAAILSSVVADVDYNFWDPNPACVAKGLCPEVHRSDGYLSYDERYLFYLINMARLDPGQYKAISGLKTFACGMEDDESSTTLTWSTSLSHHAKFHARMMATRDVCFKLETCGDCEKFGGSCTMESRLRKYYSPRATELIVKGTAIEALNSLFEKMETCFTLMSAKWSSLGVGRAKGDSGAVWSLSLGETEEFLTKAAVVGTHSSDDTKIRFSAVYNDLRTDEGLKDALLYVDNVPFLLLRNRAMKQLSLGMTGVYEHFLPATDLEKFADEDRTSEENHCHYYYFLFRTAHTSSIYRMPENGYFYLTGYGGCTDVYTPNAPSNPHHEKVEEFTEEFLNERRRVVLERESQRLNKYRNVSAKKVPQPWEPNWIYWVIGLGVGLFVVVKYRKTFMRKVKHTIA